LAAFIAGTTLAMAAAAEAKIYKSLVNTGGSEVLNSETYHELSTAGATSMSFKLSSKRRIAVSFTAECGAAPENVIWVGIEIDGTIVKPTDDRDAVFCTGVETASSGTIEGFNTHTVIVTKVLGAGNHTVRVKKALLGPGPSNIEDSTIYVHD
jgi:hypothetical protein